MNRKILISFIFFVVYSISSNAQCNVNAGSDTTVCLGKSITLNGSYNSTPTDFYILKWSPSTDLSCSNCTSPVFTPTAAGSYTFTFSVQSTNGCNDSDKVNITVITPPVANFTFGPDGACAGTTVNFNASGSGPYSWDFGDPTSSSNSSTLQNPSHSFSAIGQTSFDVKLTVGDPKLCPASITKKVNIKPTPYPKLVDQSSDFKNCSGTQFQLTVVDSTQPSPNASYQIKWGDGSPDYSSTSFPSSGVNHTYFTQGVFTLTYSVTGTNGCVGTRTYKVSNITNPAIGAPNPGGTQGCAPVQACFPIANFETNHPSTIYEVNFGDGTAPVTYSHPPPNQVCHDYYKSSCGDQGNAFTFTIKAKNNCDSTTATNSPIRIFDTPDPEINTNGQTFCVNTDINFNNLSTGYGNNCSSTPQFIWDWGDGSNTESVFGTGSKTHRYSSPGCYWVKLTGKGCTSKTDSLQVCIESPLTNVDFSTGDGYTGCVTKDVRLTNHTTELQYQNPEYLWTSYYTPGSCSPNGSSPSISFIDGTNKYSTHPTIRFSTVGTYKIILTARNSCGTLNNYKDFTISDKPQVSINSFPDICVGDSVKYSANYQDCLNSIKTYTWTLTGGTPNNYGIAQPGYTTYNGIGTFAVKISATNDCGTSTDIDSVTVSAKPTAPTTPSALSFCQGDKLQLVASTVPGSYHWSGPNGFISSLEDPYISNAQPSHSGNYNVYVDNKGCRSTTSSTNVSVNIKPKVTVSPIKDSICAEEYDTLRANGAINYSWNGSSPVAGYINDSTVIVRPGTYTVTGTSNGCSDSATANIYSYPVRQADVGPDRIECNQPIPVTFTATPPNGTWAGSFITSDGVFTPNGTGVFNVFYYPVDEHGCNGDPKSLKVTVIDRTPADAGPDRQFCQNDPAYTLSGNPSPGTWSGSYVAPNGVFTPTTTGTFELFYTQGTGTCQTKDSTDITVKPVPLVTVGNDTTVCENSSPFNLTGTPSGGTWTGNSISPSGTFTPTSAGSGTHWLKYIFTESTTSCSATDSLKVIVLKAPVVDAGPDTTLCNQPVATPISGYPSGGTWSGANITPSGIFTPSGTGSFIVVYTYSDGKGCKVSDDRIINVINATAANAGNDQSVCLGSPSFNLTGFPSPGTWSGSYVNAAGLFSPTNSGSYTLTYSQGKGSCLTTDQVVITVNSLPTVNAGSDQKTCIQSSPFNLVGNPAGGIWSGTAINPSGTFTPSIAGTGSYTLTYSYTDPVTGCKNTDAAVVTVYNNPLINAGNDTTFCNQPIQARLIGSPTGGTWSGSGISTNGYYTPSGNGVFTVSYTYTNSNGCSSSDNLDITVVDPTPTTVGSDFGICIGSASIILNGNPSGGTWSGTNVTTAGVFTPLTAGIQTLTYSVGPGTCKTSDRIDITVHAKPSVNAGPNQSTCTNTLAFQLTGTPSGGTWMGSGVNASGIFNPSTSGTGVKNLNYSYTDPSTGCSSTSGITITVNSPSLVNAGADRIECDQEVPINLTGTPGGGTWSGPLVTPTGTFTPNGTGSYALSYAYTNSFGCTASDQMNITVGSPSPVNAGNDTVLCQNSGTIRFDGIPAGGTWSGLGITAAGNFSPTTAGVFNLTYLKGTGTCQTSDVKTVTVNALPVLNLGGNTNDCINETAYQIQVTPTGGTWSGSMVSPSGIFNPSAAGLGTYVLTYSFTDPYNGCKNSGTKTITVNSLPMVSAGTDKQLCDQPIVEKMIGSPLGGSWSGPNVSPSGDYTPNGTGIFNLTYFYTDSKGCSSSDQVQLNVVPSTPVKAGSDFGKCFGSLDTLLTGTPTGGTWIGNRITSSGLFNFQKAGIYPVVYAKGTGTCKTTDTLTVNVYALPTITHTPVSTCLNIDTIPLSDLNTNPAGGQFAGSGISTDRLNFLPSTMTPGVHQVDYTYTDQNQCSLTIHPQITVNAIPSVSAGPDTSFCASGISGQLTGNPVGSGGYWSGLYVDPTGKYSTNQITSEWAVFHYTDTKGCVNSDSVFVTVKQHMTASTQPGLSTCINTPSFQLSASPLGGNWAGTGVTTNGLFTPAIAGNHVLTYTVGQGTCISTSALSILVNNLPTVIIGPDTSLCEGSPDVTLHSNYPGTGTWAGNGITDPFTGNYSPSAAPPGIHLVLYTYTDPQTLCSNSASKLVTVLPKPLVNTNGADTICDTAPVQFDALPAGGFWNGVNITSGGLYTPTGVGTFDLRYGFTDNQGCTGTDTLKLVVINQPAINAGSDQYLCTDNSSHLLTGFPLGGVWSGSPQVSPNGLLNLSQPGNYTLTYTSGFGMCLNSDQVNVAINTLPQLTAIALPAICNNEVPLTLDQVSPAGGIWTGNGVIGNIFDPKLNPPGNYSLNYRYTNPATGCSKDTTLYINVHPAPVSSFTAPNLVCMNALVSFSNLSSGATSFFWSFGDGANANIHTPSHIYNSTGINSIQLLSTNNFGCRDSVSQIIEVIDKPAASFQMSDSMGCLTKAILFSNTSYSPHSVFYWNTGNGFTYNTTDPPVQIYTTPAGSDRLYVVTLSINNQCGSDLYKDTVFISSSVPTANFMTSSDTVCEMSPVTFINLSSANAPYSLWSFGDGLFSSVTNPASHLYDIGSNSANYTCRLTVYNGCGNNFIEKPIVIFPEKPTAAANIGPQTGCVPYHFSGQSAVLGAENVFWKFGDGNTSQLSSAIHLYSTPGNYAIELIAINRCGQDTFNVNVTANPIPDASFSVSNNTLCADKHFNFSVNNPGNTSMLWDFGDLNSSNLLAPTHRYLPGNYLVSLTLKDAITGCSSTESTMVNALDYPVPGISAIDSVICENEPLQFVNNSTHTDNYTWDFGDGQHSTEAFPSVFLSQAGPFEVKLTVSNANGCTNDTSVFIQVNPKPIAGFRLSTSVVSLVEDGVNLICEAIHNDATYYQLNGFGIQLYSCDGHLNLNRFLPGTYLVKQEVYTDLGCVDSLTRTLTILPEYQVNIPNAFTPGENDTLNRVFKPVLFGITSMTFKVMTRWGITVFETTNPELGWNGLMMNDGEACKPDTYIWQFSGTNELGETIIRQGRVNLLR